MRTTAGEGPGVIDADAAWRPVVLGCAVALAFAAAAAVAIAPFPDALRKAEVPARSVAWLAPYMDGAPAHWFEGGNAGQLRDLPRDGRLVQVAILVEGKPAGAGDTLLFLPAASRAPSVYINGADVPSNAVEGAPYPAAVRMRPIAVRIPRQFFRPSLNRVDASFPGAAGPVLMAPPLLGDAARMGPMVARLSTWTGPLRDAAAWSCLVAAILALAASAFAAARGCFLGLAAAAAAFGCRLLPEAAGLPPWLATHPALLDRALLAAGLASLACAAMNRPRIGARGKARFVAGALAASTAAMALVAVREAFEPFSGAWLPWLEAFHGCNLVSVAIALASASAWISGRGMARFASHQLDLSRAVRRQRIEIEQANRALEVQTQRAAILEERQRLARDVHDGVGGTLASLLARIRMRRIDIGQIESELVGGLADLRLIVDSMDATGGSLATALAVFRARIAPQVEAAGMALRWEQPDSPGDYADDPSWMLHLYRLMQEAVNNALRHSGGRNLQVSIRPLEARRLRIEIADDGIGLPAQRASHGNGLANMDWRARRLGASLRFEPAAAGGTRVVLELALPGAAQPREGIRPS